MFNTAKKQIPTCPSIKQSPKQSSKLIDLRSSFWRLKNGKTPIFIIHNSKCCIVTKKLSYESAKSILI